MAWHRHSSCGQKWSNITRSGLLMGILAALSFLSFTSAEPSAYEQLVEHGLPPGLLPPTVLSYILNPDGSFSVQLSGQCYSSVNNGKIQIYFASSLTGVLREGKLANLKGISVKPPQTAWLWVQVNSIYVDAPYPASGKIYFAVAYGITKSLDVTEFETSRTCSNNVRPLLQSKQEPLTSPGLLEQLWLQILQMARPFA